MSKILIIIAIVIVVGAGYLLLSRERETVVSNFEECVAAGNPVMESYPRQCRHDDVTYTEELDDEVTDTATSADDAPPGSIHNLPVPDAVTAVKKYVANESGVREGLIIVMTAYEKEWSDSCLGLGGPAESCLAAITPGYEVTVQVNGREETYRTNADGSEIRKEE